IVARERVVESGAREIADRDVDVEHGERDTAACKAVPLVLDLGAVFALEDDLERAFAGHAEIGGAIHVAVSVASDHDRLGPAWHQPWHVLADDRLAEDHPAQDVADGAIRRLPHLLKVELL